MGSSVRVFASVARVVHSSHGGAMNRNLAIAKLRKHAIALDPPTSAPVTLPIPRPSVHRPAALDWERFRVEDIRGQRALISMRSWRWLIELPVRIFEELQRRPLVYLISGLSTYTSFDGLRQFAPDMHPGVLVCAIILLQLAMIMGLGVLVSAEPQGSARRGFWGAVYLAAVIPSILLSFGFWISWLDADVSHTRNQVAQAVQDVQDATSRASRDLDALAIGALALATHSTTMSKEEATRGGSCDGAVALQGDGPIAQLRRDEARTFSALARRTRNLQSQATSRASTLQGLSKKVARDAGSPKPIEQTLHKLRTSLLQDYQLWWSSTEHVLQRAERRASLETTNPITGKATQVACPDAVLSRRLKDLKRLATSAQASISAVPEVSLFDHTSKTARVERAWALMTAPLHLDGDKPTHAFRQEEQLALFLGVLVDMAILALVLLSTFDLATRAQRVLDLHRRSSDAPITFTCCRVLGWGFVVISDDSFFQDLMDGIERRHGTHLPGVRRIPPEGRTGQALLRYLTWRGILPPDSKPFALHVLHPRVAERVLYAADCEVRLQPGRSS